ncbi:MAG: hypothetical protein RL693_1744 [Verrucomicrobiota bacterium]|jgi:hypothetical protein
MNYIESITDFFKSPKWMMNLLFGGICILIPVIGPIVLMGWLITGFWSRQDESMETFPDFDFGNFSKYLERGLWPFLVLLASSFAMMILFFILVAIPSVIIGVVFGNQDSGGFIASILGLLIFCFELVLMAGMHLVLTPLLIRATILQDFMPSFNLAFIKKFISLTWLEIILSGLFISVAGAVLGGIGFIALCVGIYFAMALVYFGWAHLGKQLYKLYLSRGGEEIALSPKLTDAAPPSVV